MSGFLWGVNCEIHVPNYRRAILSVPEITEGSAFGEKDLLAAGPVTTEGKHTLTEHLKLIEDEEIQEDASFLVFGIRNNLVNLRAPIISRGAAYAVEGEQPELSQRPYYGLGSRNGNLFLGQALGGSKEVWPEFFVAGVPVLWDDLDEDTLLDLMLVEAGDHSHFFNLPRGNHPKATEATRDRWLQLHNAFRAVVHANFPTAVSEMRSALAAINPPPERCENYLNAVFGIRPDGEMVCIYAHGRLEVLGKRAKALGCRRAVCVENSGSVMPTYLPSGLDGRQVPLLRAPNHRPHGRGVLIIQLDSATFDSFPL